MQINLIKKLTSQETFSQALKWLIAARKEYSANNDIWHLLEHWQDISTKLRQQLCAGSFRFSPLQIYEFHDKTIALYSAIDSLVLKAISLVLGEHLQDKLPRECVHLKNHGGLKLTVQQLWEHLPQYKYILKSDIRSFYESIDHQRLIEEIDKLVPDQHFRHLVYKSLPRTETRGGLFFDKDKGIALSSPLSPLLAAIALVPLDIAFNVNKPNFFYRRFMDDYIILCHTRNQLKKAVKLMWQILNEHKLTIATEKTYIGKSNKGLSFLGYSFSPDEFTVANQTILKHLLNRRKLFEQGASLEALAEFQKRFESWCTSGVRLMCRCINTSALCVGMKLKPTISIQTH